MRRTTPLIFIVLVVHGGVMSIAGSAERPNIVLLISDDHDYEDLGFMGNQLVHTPSLDRLADAGTVFTTAHLPMSRCHPTLASFLSGRWPHQSGIYYNYGARQLDPANSLPNLLKNAGYATYVEGKFWEGDPRAMGFTHGAGKTANSFVRKGQAALFQFLNAVGSRQPFFVWWAPKIPHTPHNPPPRFRAIYDTARIPVPAWFQGDAALYRKKQHTLLAMVSWLDEGVAELVKELRRLNLYDNTLFVFVIDNGWCNGLPSKGSPFEKGVRTPIFVTWPGRIDAGQRIDTLVSTLDIYPTILDYAGVKVPETAAGRSLRAAIEGEGEAPRETLFGAIYPAFATRSDQRPERDVYALYARTTKWKYIYYLQDVREKRNQDYFRVQSILTEYPERNAGGQDLYDLESDPYELHNLAGRPEHEQRRKQFQAEVLDWWKRTGGQPLKGS